MEALGAAGGGSSSQPMEMAHLGPSLVFCVIGRPPASQWSYVQIKGGNIFPQIFQRASLNMCSGKQESDNSVFIMHFNASIHE